MAKNNNGKKRRKNQFTIPVAVVLGMAPVIYRYSEGVKVGGFHHGLKEVIASLTGFDYWAGQWRLDNMKGGAFPLFAAFGVHMLATKFGINRVLAQSRIPIIRI